MTPIRVVVIDGGADGKAIAAALDGDPRIRVVGTASSLEGGVERTARLDPDVVTLDLGLAGDDRRGSAVRRTIEQIMARRAIPILVMSGHDDGDHPEAVEALAAGAVDLFPRPVAWDHDAADALRRRIAVLSRLRMTTRHRRATRAAPPPPEPATALGPVIGLVSSTGGPSALQELLASLVGVPAPILLVQHIHREFVTSFVTWLQRTSGIPTTIVRHGEPLRPGTIHMAPADVHLRLGARRSAVLDPEPRSTPIRPSGDELLRSLAARAGSDAIAAVLTGMGEDGARGLLAVREAGGLTFAQDLASCAVDGMPRTARALGATDRLLVPEHLGAAIAAAVGRRAPR